MDIANSENGEAIKEQTPGADNKIDEIDIDLNDPEVSDAATKIQAQFRGHQA